MSNKRKTKVIMLYTVAASTIIMNFYYTVKCSSTSKNNN